MPGAASDPFGETVANHRESKRGGDAGSISSIDTHATSSVR
jgi:hypothetical protein